MNSQSDRRDAMKWRLDARKNRLELQQSRLFPEEVRLAGHSGQIAIALRQRDRAKRRPDGDDHWREASLATVLP